MASSTGSNRADGPRQRPGHALWPGQAVEAALGAPPADAAEATGAHAGDVLAAGEGAPAAGGGGGERPRPGDDASAPAVGDDGASAGGAPSAASPTVPAAWGATSRSATLDAMPGTDDAAALPGLGTRAAIPAPAEAREIPPPAAGEDAPGPGAAPSQPFYVSAVGIAGAGGGSPFARAPLAGGAPPARGAGDAGPLAGAPDLAADIALAAPRRASFTPFDIASGSFSDLFDALLACGETIDIEGESESYGGVAGQGSTFTGGFDLVGFGRGILFTTGDGTPRQQSDDGALASTDHATSGDPDIEAAAIAAFGEARTFDANTLRFEFDVRDSSVTSVTFDVAFGSEEYPDFADGPTDIAAVFVNGVNYALFSDRCTRPLAVTQENLAATDAVVLNHDDDDAIAPLAISYNALSARLTITAPIVQGVNELRIGIADVRDGEVDSGLFIGNLRFGASEADPGMNIPNRAARDTFLIENDDGPTRLGNVLGNDTDGDGDRLRVVGIFGPDGTSGTVGEPFGVDGEGGGGFATLCANGNLVFDPDGEWDFVDPGEFVDLVLDYLASDGTDTASAPIRIRIFNNARPVSEDDRFTVVEGDGSAVLGNVLANDTDTEGGELTVVDLPGTDASVGEDFSPRGGGLARVDANGDITFDPLGDFERLGEGEVAEVRIRYTASDGGTARETDTATAVIEVTGVNDGPVSALDAFTVSEDGPAATGNVLGNDSDVDENDTLTVVAVAGGEVGEPIELAAGGIVTIAANGDFRFDPAGDFDFLGEGETREVEVEYIVSDGRADDTGIVLIEVVGVNDGPVAADDELTALEDGTPATGNVLGNDADPEDDLLTVVAVAGSAGQVGVPVALAEGGSVLIAADGDIRFDPGGDFQDLGEGEVLEIAVEYTVSDGRASDTATALIEVVGVNDGPAAARDTLAAGEDGPAATGNVLENDGDPDGDLLAVVAVAGGTVGDPISLAGGGIVTIAANGTIRFDPDGDFEALAEGEVETVCVDYTVSDGRATDVATAVIEITGVNDGPAAARDELAAGEDGPVVTGNVLENDTDPDGDDLTVVAVAGSAANVGEPVALAGGGTVRIAADGALTFDPDDDFERLAAGETAEVGVQYTVSDGRATDIGTVTIEVVGANDGPVATADAFTVDADAPAATGNVLANDDDVDDSDVLTVVAVAGGTVGEPIALPGGGVVTLSANGAFRFNPSGDFQDLAEGEVETIAVSYTVSDGRATDVATATIEVVGVNDDPVAAGDTLTAGEDGPAATGDVLANDSDPDADELLVVAVQGAAGLVGEPIALAEGGVVRIGADGAITFDADGDFERLGEGEVETIEVAYTVSDGRERATATAVIEVIGVNDAPIAEDDALSVGEDGPVAGGNVIGNDGDPEDDALTVVAVAGGAVGAPVELAGGGTVTIAADGGVTFDPGGDFARLDEGEVATVEIDYTVSDGIDTDTATLSITVTGGEDAPSIAPDVFAVAEDAPLVTGNVLANDVDPDGDRLAVVAVDGGEVGAPIALAGGGIVRIAANGTLHFDPDGDFTQLDAGEVRRISVGYTVSDGAGTVDATATIEVRGGEDLPLAADDSYGVDADASAVTLGSVFANDRDPDAEPMTVVAVRGRAADVGVPVALAGGGVVNILANGNVRFNPRGDFDHLDAGEVATVSVQYTVSDGTGTATATVEFQVSGREDAPLAADDAFTVAEDGPALAANVLANDRDPDGDRITVVAVAGGAVGAPVEVAGGGVVRIAADGTLAFDPAGDFDDLAEGERRTVTVSYTVSDGGRLATADAVISVIGGADPIFTPLPDGYDGEDGDEDLDALEGDDTVRGGGGDDRIAGNDGDDVLSGEDGRDLLAGGLGGDVMAGGADDDRLFGQAGRDLLRGDAGNDGLSGGDERDALFGGTGNDTISGGTERDRLHGDDGDDLLRGEDGDDGVAGGSGRDALRGWTGNDTMSGGADADRLFGDDGNDLLRGDGGNDSLSGGRGRDVLFGGTSGDTLLGGADRDRLLGEDWHDRLRGEDGDDALAGGDGRDSLDGGAGNDRLYGDAGRDTLAGGGGEDSAKGGGGGDVFVLRQGRGHLVIADFGDGEDRLDLVGLVRAGLILTADGIYARAEGGGDDDLLAVFSNGLSPRSLSDADFL